MNNNMVKLIDQVGLDRLFRLYVLHTRGTVNQAGKTIGLTCTSNIVTSIRRAEDSLGVTLLDGGGFSKTPYTLTEKGQALAETIAPLFEQLPQAIATSLHP